MRHLVAYVADEQRGSAPRLSAVLEDILATPVSPELLPPKEGEIAQKTEDLVGPYELHDFFLYYAVRWGFRPRKVFRLAEYALGEKYDRATRLQLVAEFLPPLLRPAVQALLPAGRTEGRFRDPLAQRGLADALGRCRNAVAGRGGALDHLTEKGEGRMALSLSL